MIETSTTMVATAVKEAIDDAIQRDGGNEYRRLLGEIMPTLDDAYRVSKYKFRPHMGASLQGNPCARAIWYSFRWYTEPKFSGRILRLFNRGHLEEGRMVAALRMIGVNVFQYDQNGKQFTIHGASGHYGGSGDGILNNVLGLNPQAYVLSEFKTHSETSFKKLVKEGMRQSKYEHYVQMQQYMYKMQLPYGLYGAVNKNTDEMHWEYVCADKEIGRRYTERAENIVWLKEAPVRAGNPPSPGNYNCRYCDHKPVCWQGHLPARNCRTCRHAEAIATPEENGTWVCNKFAGVVLTRDQQELSCQQWDPLECK